MYVLRDLKLAKLNPLYTKQIKQLERVFRIPNLFII